MKIRIKRIYEKAEHSDGYRILIDRLWPRGVKKEKAMIDVWLKDVGPSMELRQWFDHDPDKWDAFLVSYKKELSQLKSFEDLKAMLAKHKSVTLLYAAKDTAHNNAVALVSYLIDEMHP